MRAFATIFSKFSNAFELHLIRQAPCSDNSGVSDVLCGKFIKANETKKTQRVCITQLASFASDEDRDREMAHACRVGDIGLHLFACAQNARNRPASHLMFAARRVSDGTIYRPTRLHVRV